ncbi:hypothetical protein I3843_04G103500 [Carya illinoinensis]|uniref:Uncharacterized protein n=1 Tax=Carya illinoinensis TaxID=32201 RepID=A0A8T1QU44_CARIL|nr:hypothetical protein I3760_04G111300 [Carya illinoinensis]KAG6657743.1 hypothetical protein CIPAW_04G112100 [Carya illinoinensis]KAG6717636.1 hypothetical protein I3842_04G110900 [Carya illinoinensis]KAG7983383.1 hypothetical protein I3843_04G103500 [Carya illinoinensis]
MSYPFQCLCLLVALLGLVFTPIRLIDGIRVSSVPGPPSTATAQVRVFRPKVNNATPFASHARDYQSEMRKVPTGSNPLHNKRRR